MCVYLQQVATEDMMLQVSLVSTSPAHLISRSETTIKPASPSPLNLKRYNLPLHDRMMPNIYMPLIYFYPNLEPILPDKTTISNLLKNSLSETLSVYYPFAGRLMSGSYVECNDDGVSFVEAEIGCKLSQFLEKAPIKDKEGGFGHLFPPRSIWNNVSYPSLLLVQLNHFACGGIALAVSLSHRIADGATLFSFLNYWSSLSRNSLDHQKLLHLCPRFPYELLPQSYDNKLIATEIVFPEKCWNTKEIIFYNTKIAQLKATMNIEDKLKGLADQHYAKHELVAALLYKSAVAAAASNSAGNYPKTVLFETVNVRRMIDPRLPNTSVGNFFAFNDIPTSTKSETTNLNLLVKRMRKGKKQLRGIKNMEGKEAGPLLEKYPEIHHKVYIISSICNFPLYDGMDFGWGRPVKATVVDLPFVNSMFMMDTPSGDGISTIIGLEEEDMNNLQLDKDMLTYATIRE